MVAHSPLFPEHFYAAGWLLGLLALLVLLRRGRSPTAVGAFLGAGVGCVAAWCWGRLYDDLVAYVYLGLLFGAPIGFLVGTLWAKPPGGDRPADGVISKE